MTELLDPLAAITERQYEVLAVRCRLPRTAMVAAELGIAQQTVKNHLLDIYRTFGTVDALQTVHRLGWVTVPDRRTLRAHRLMALRARIDAELAGLA